MQGRGWHRWRWRQVGCGNCSYLDTLGYLKKGSIAHTGYFAILWYCTYCSMCNTHTWAVLQILDTVLRIPDTSTLDVHSYTCVAPRAVVACAVFLRISEL